MRPELIALVYSAWEREKDCYTNTASYNQVDREDQEVPYEWCETVTSQQHAMMISGNHVCSACFYPLITYGVFACCTLATPATLSASSILPRHPLLEVNTNAITSSVL